MISAAAGRPGLALVRSELPDLVPLDASLDDSLTKPVGVVRLDALFERLLAVPGGG